MRINEKLERRSDSAGYQAGIINFYEAHGITYAIRARMDAGCGENHLHHQNALPFSGQHWPVGLPRKGELALAKEVNQREGGSIFKVCGRRVAVFR